MKKALIGVCVLLMIGLVSFGCKKKEEPKPNVGAAINKVEEKAGETAEAAKEAAGEAAKEAEKTAEEATK